MRRQTPSSEPEEKAVGLRIGNRSRRACLALPALAVLMALPSGAPRAQEAPAAAVKIGFLGEQVKREAPQPYLDPPPADDGVAGARLGVADDNTTGHFTGQQFTLVEALVPEGGDVTAAFRKLAGEGVKLIVADLPEAPLLAVAALPEAHDVTLFNTAAPDDDLRADKCRANLLHTMPSRAMLADALLEYLMVKQWRNVFLVVGPTDGDRAYAAAMKRSIAKFGAKLVAEKPWTYQPGSKRSDTGHYAIAAQVANFTQGVSYDVLIVADEDDQFGDFVSYSTYTPRPVAGTQGLVPTAWARPHEEWGATQLQDRFRHASKRWMTVHDYTAWLAARAVGEAAARAQTVEPDKLMAFMRSDQFELGGYKGTPLSFRPWDGQMRQAVLLADARALVSVSPPPGRFLHQVSELDTLGIDRPETKCHLK
jgi:ABC transporter substrate binding protein (PQQ-dependent alcohol dehydrogenase system)